MEAVIIPVGPGASRPRTTLCVSSQVGCAQNCQFCFTGRMGLRAQLSAAQIVEQVCSAPASCVTCMCTSVVLHQTFSCCSALYGMSISLSVPQTLTLAHLPSKSIQNETSLLS